MKIYTLTPNPALDLSGNVQRLVPNEKNYVKDERRDPGGNGINAARIATRLGAKTLALGYLGGATGEEIKMLLKKEKVATRFTPIHGHTRVNVTVSNQETHQQTRLTFPGPEITQAELKALLKEIRSLKAPGIFILGGSLPKGCPDSFHAQVTKAAYKQGLGVIVDVPAKWIESILELEDVTPLMLKPNQTELEEWYGIPLKTDDQIAIAAMEMAQKVSIVCVSLADRGAILAACDRAWFAEAPKVQAKGTVGAGDSMVGAMAARLIRSGVTRADQFGLAACTSSDEIPPILAEMLQWGLAAGAATAQVSGTSLAQADAIRKLTGKVKIRSLDK